MGTPPAPLWATIFYTLHEEKLFPRWLTSIPFFKRFIDDIIGVWLVHPDPAIDKRNWDAFCADLNDWHGLDWDTETPSTSVNFMDMTVTVANGKVETKLYEKPQNLYLYIPPHSSHPRGVFTGLIFGQILRIRRLCTHKHDADMSIEQFFGRLLARGHTREKLLPLFRKAEANASEYLRRSPADKELLREQKRLDSQKQLYFHLQFHPEDPSASEIQSIWREQVSHPVGDLPLADMENDTGEKVGLSQLVVAYSRPLNLRNKFTVRDIHGRGRPVSEYLVE